MSPVLAAVLLACGTGALSAFVAYWLGRGPVEKQLRVLEARHLLMHELNIDLAARVALVNHDLIALRRRMGHLTPDEAIAFGAIETHYRKEAS